MEELLASARSRRGVLFELSDHVDACLDDYVWNTCKAQRNEAVVDRLDRQSELISRAIGDYDQMMDSLQRANAYDQKNKDKPAWTAMFK